MIEQIRRYLLSQPFEPFVLQLADGRTLRIGSTDGLWITPKGGLFYWHQEDDTIERLNLLLVVGVRGHLQPAN